MHVLASDDDVLHWTMKEGRMRGREREKGRGRDGGREEEHGKESVVLGRVVIGNFTPTPHYNLYA